MVFERYPNGGGEMLLALALADHASDDGSRIYPGIAALAEKTRQSERTIQYQLRRMQDDGWLILVGNGNGGRSMASEYKISPEWVKGAEIAPFKKGASDDIKGASDSTKGCNPQHKRVQQVAPANNHHRTIIEPSKNHHKTLARPEGVTEQVWSDFLALRKAKKSNLTQTALDGIRLEAEKAGINLGDALTVCCMRGWQGFKADWINSISIPAKQTNGNRKHSGFTNLNYTEGINDDGSFA
jgi:hypothetical protein